jgi:hypothetical protein
MPKYTYDVNTDIYSFDDGTEVTAQDIAMYGSLVDAYNTKSTINYLKKPINFSGGLFTPKAPEPKTCNCGSYNQNHWADCALKAQPL